MSGDKLYLMDQGAFNYLCKQHNADFRWNDRNNNGFFEDGELNLIDDNVSSIYIDDDGNYTSALYDKIIEITKSRFISSIYQIFVDKGNDGEPINNYVLPRRECEERPPSDGTVEECKRLMTNSIQWDPDVLKSDLVQGGDLHGLMRQFPRLHSIGIDAVYHTSYKNQARATSQGHTPYSHGFSISDLCSESLSPFLADPKLSNREFLAEYYKTAQKSEMMIIPDFSFRGIVPIKGNPWTTGMDILDSGIVFCNGKPIADAYVERNALSLGSHEYISNHDPMKYVGFYFSHGGDIESDSATLVAPPDADDYYWKLTTHSFYGLFPPNLRAGSPAMKQYKKALFDDTKAYSPTLTGWRFDALHYIHGDVVKNLARAAREVFPGPEHLIGECLGTGEYWDYSRRCTRTFLLTDDPLERVDLFFFGARTAVADVFSNDRLGLNKLQWITDFYEAHNFDPRVLLGLHVMLDNHDLYAILDYVSGKNVLRRMTYDDLVSAQLFLGVFPSSIYVYYSTLAMVRDRNEMHLTHSGPEHRPKLTLPTEVNPATLNLMERAMQIEDQFREDHYRAIHFGKFEPGLKSGWGDDGIFAVRRNAPGDEIAVIVLRAQEGLDHPELELQDAQLTLTPGTWMDRITGQKFVVGINGDISPISGEGMDRIKSVPVSFDEAGVRTFGEAHACYPNNMGSSFCYDIAGRTARLPDGRWMPVNPPTGGGCDPYEVYTRFQEKTGGARKSGKHPYENCSTLITKNGEVVRVQVSNRKSNVSLRPTSMGGYTLPDGQYFLDRGGENCESWVVSETHSTARHVSEICGSIQDEVLWVRDGKVQMIPRTRVLYLEKVNQENQGGSK